MQFDGDLATVWRQREVVTFPGSPRTPSLLARAIEPGQLTSASNRCGPNEALSGHRKRRVTVGVIPKEKCVGIELDVHPMLSAIFARLPEEREASEHRGLGKEIASPGQTADAHSAYSAFEAMGAISLRVGASQIDASNGDRVPLREKEVTAVREELRRTMTIAPGLRRGFRRR